MDPKVEKLIEAIDGEIADARGMAARCNVLTAMASAVGFVASGAATLFAAARVAEGLVLASIAAIPAIAAGVGPTFKLGPRVVWHTEKCLRLVELRDQLSFGLITPEQAVKSKASILLEMERKWNTTGPAALASETRRLQEAPGVRDS